MVVRNTSPLPIQVQNRTGLIPYAYYFYVVDVLTFKKMDPG